MKFGVVIFTTQYSISPSQLAIAVEERGIESVWFPEHSHIPLPRVSPFPGGGDLPQIYYDVFDPFAALASAAAVTQKIKLGTGICLVVQRDPIQLAKQVASLDQISNGRFLFGIGAGWNAEEMRDHGTGDFKDRFRLMNERVGAMRSIWSNEKAEYTGKYVNFGSMIAFPKPFQKPHPPIMVGGGFPQGAKRALRYGNAWMPSGVSSSTMNIYEVLPRFRQLAAEFERNPAEVPVTYFNLDSEMSEINKLQDAGVDRLVFALPSKKQEIILPILDRLAKRMPNTTL
ncbi:MAG: LLM class F420-dependent oxidoreductase [Rhodospirillaceae bacterium]|nr:LLM class F420-dependent oxidoreductase [Rhodospirillaceae bacterium]|tara:strand:+ start:229 stop:1086 length:858 start_codon:yes stop_codon:yes gene_type:complete